MGHTMRWWKRTDCTTSCSIFSRKALAGQYNFGGEALTGQAVLQYDNLCIDPNQRRVFVSGRAVKLTTMEFNILYYLALHPRLDFYPGAALPVCNAQWFCLWPWKRYQPDLQDTEKTKYQCDSNCAWVWLSLWEVEVKGSGLCWSMKVAPFCRVENWN